ncbi:MAG: hypothetical protein U0R17_07765 [Acidimicrobiia bacterium]
MEQWNKTVLDGVDKVIDIATKKIVKPAHSTARFSVYGLVIGTLALLSLFFLVIAAFRATTLLMEPYLAYTLWGIFFIVIGSIIWAKR